MVPSWCWSKPAMYCADWSCRDSYQYLRRRVAHGSLLRLDIDLFPFAPFSDRVWALRSNLTSYDAWYVAMAEFFDCPLVTLDWKLSRASGLRCEVVTPVTASDGSGGTQTV